MAHDPSYPSPNFSPSRADTPMRAETEALVTEIKQSFELLRRHL